MGDKTGQVKPLPITLQTAGGSAVSYASAAAFTASGWTVTYEIAGVVVTPSWSWVVADATTGRHEILLTLQYGKGTFYVFPPSGYVANVEAFILDVESNSLDDVAGLIQSSAGAPTVDSGQTTYAFQTPENDGFNRSITVGLTPLSNFGESDLSWVTSATGACRAPINRLATSPDYTFTVDVTDSANRVIAIGWTTFPTGGSISGGTITAVSTSNKTFSITGDARNQFRGVSALRVWNSTGGNDGDYTLASMTYTGGSTVLTVNETILSGTADGTLAQAADSKDFDFDVQLVGVKTYAITAVNTGTKKYTLSGDKQRFFNVGGAFTVTGSTGNNGTYTVTVITYTGGNTVLTVSEVVPSAVADGSVNAPLKITPVRGTITVTRQEDRT